MQYFLYQLQEFLISLPAILLALSLHEMAHGWAAYRLGDPTAKYMGRLSMNPLHHIDPVGFLCLALFHVGWAKPVNVNARYFKNPKRDMAITALAGPLTNFILAFVFGFVYIFFWWLGIQLGLFLGEYATVYYVFCRVIAAIVVINIGLGVFNLIPIPPLDGSKILYAFLPGRIIFKILPYERYIQLALMVLLCFGFLSGPISAVVDLITEWFLFLPKGIFF